MDERKIEHIVEVPGLWLFHDALTREEEEALLREIDATPWSTTLERRTQHYGFTYDYKKQHSAYASELAISGAIAQLRDRIEESLASCGVRRSSLNQVIVNEYVGVQGIGAHKDSEIFGMFIIGVNLGSPIGMEFSRNDKRVNVWMPSRSYYVMSWAARTAWTHAIPSTRITIGPGECALYREPDFRRVSITFRSILPDKISAAPQSGVSSARPAYDHHHPHGTKHLCCMTEEEIEEWSKDVDRTLLMLGFVPHTRFIGGTE
jgi:alkylated DNA repair dioxygenase AlkB